MIQAFSVINTLPWYWFVLANLTVWQLVSSPNCPEFRTNKLMPLSPVASNRLLKKSLSGGTRGDLWTSVSLGCWVNVFSGDPHCPLGSLCIFLPHFAYYIHFVYWFMHYGLLPYVIVRGLFIRYLGAIAPQVHIFIHLHSIACDRAPSTHHFCECWLHYSFVCGLPFVSGLLYLCIIQFFHPNRRSYVHRFIDCCTCVLLNCF